MRSPLLRKALREKAHLGRGAGTVQPFQHDEFLQYIDCHRRRV
jgi:hypothetical protein